MYWEKILGKKLHARVLNYLRRYELSISAFVRLAVVEYLDKHKK